MIKYPFEIFELEKVEIYPFERFAYNALTAGVQTLKSKNLPHDLTVNLTENKGFHLDVYVAIKYDLEPYRFEIITNVYTPPILVGICHVFGKSLYPSDKFDALLNDNNGYYKLLFDFGTALNHARKESHDDCGKFSTLLFEKIGLGIHNISEISHYYDLCSKMITYHEVAHAYIGQLSSGTHTPLENRAFEIIADLTAMTWFYRKMIVGTPDSAEYRKLRGTSTHEESLVVNTIDCLNAINLMLTYFGLANAFMKKGQVTLEGGKHHPHSFFRCFIQNIHLSTLVQSNYNFASKDLEIVDAIWSNYTQLLFKNGFISTDDFTKKQCVKFVEELNLIPGLVEEYDIMELKNFVPAIDGITDVLLNMQLPE
ncbi:MAG TPA: hypothetical protein VF487_01690 [Chitinophagaceae bacterium]